MKTIRLRRGRLSGLFLLALLLACRSPGDGADTSAVGRSPDSDGDGVVDVLDCAPDDPEASPAGTEVCDGVDNDCDGDTDELASDAVFCYPDLDADGYGDPAGPVVLTCACAVDESEDATDCDDGERYANPGEVEICGDGLDNDCENGVDDAGAADAATWYTDADGDGYGDETEGVPGCAAPDGTVNDATDCDDGDASIHPGADETCDGLDQNCDGSVDEDPSDGLLLWFWDGDGDGYGDASATMSACADAMPAGYVRAAGDCEDADPAISPAATELCDGVDNNCDGEIDEGVKGTWYRDADGDGYGDASMPRETCAAFVTDLMVADDTDCDDDQEAVHPGATEECNGRDDNCDGETDEDSAEDALLWYPDADGDGYGSATGAVSACAQPTGTVSEADIALAEDCDDGDAEVSPVADEICDGVDDDCDGETDEVGAVDGAIWYIDADGDGYGSKAGRIHACEAPAGYAAVSTDCEDGDASISPAADEVCDGSIDNDCDGDIDEVGAVDGATWYRDADGDGYGTDSRTEQACTLPSGYAAVGGDRDDGDPAVH